MARSAERESARWERSFERGSSCTGVDKEVPPGDLRRGGRGLRALGRPVSVRTAALRGEAGKSGDSKGANAARANGFSDP
ncbi:hypothetical protein GCM10023323_41040 [Streptomyces thinghirensis]|uniref:Uncharacterized protein n=1 Tax=Streptomyces thinghirensis TaxID=551547 RepID=A0ABP9T8Z5_9ACTN